MIASIWAVVTLDAQDPSAPRFGSGIDLVALDVCVSDREGRPVPSLNATEFLVFEDRVPQRLTFFSAEGEIPLTAVVLIDRSSSMQGPKLERAKAAAVTFLQHGAIVFWVIDGRASSAAPDSAARILRTDAVSRVARARTGSVVLLHSIAHEAPTAGAPGPLGWVVRPVREALGSGIVIDSQGLMPRRSASHNRVTGY